MDIDICGSLQPVCCNWGALLPLSLAGAAQQLAALTGALQMIKASRQLSIKAGWRASQAGSSKLQYGRG